MQEEYQESFEENEEKSFAELLEESFIKPERLEPGQKVKAVIVKITPETVFIDLGGKSEGYIDSKEFLDAEGRLTVKEGDTIQAYFLSKGQNEKLFTTKIGAGDSARRFLEEAWQNGIPVEGLVEREIKGGFEVKIAGNVRSFCPFSQMGLHRVNDPGQFIGQRLHFKITEYAEKGRNVIVSNRAVLEEERQAQKELLKKSLQEGMTVKGVITSIRDFGAFVNIGAIEGLLPVSEISWGRVEDIRNVLNVGQEVEVVIVKLDWENDRFSFSLKEALPDPWDTAEAKYPVGSYQRGTVVRLTNFGAFVSLGEGVDGLLHISKLGAGKRINHPREVLAVGQTVEVKIESLDKDNKRISLSMVLDNRRDEEEDATGDYESYLEEKPKSMGTLGDMLKAKLSKKNKK
ncbi:MAG: 30S ribosomal protein S1 [Deltaproteobacteria bacterium]|nr:30S ribosomal protein S1 [Deltaproteobacteria bacterium]